MSATATATPLPKRVNDLRGQTFGLLTVLECVGKLGNSRHAWWKVQCSCPTKKIFNVVGYALVRGKSKSCGCLVAEVGRRNRTHGMSKTPEYQAWISARKRTRDPKCPEYWRYGGRGITMTDELYDNFEPWNKELGPRPSPDHSVDRIKNEGNYERGNLKWSTAREQALNKRTNRYLEFNGIRKKWAEWEVEYGLPKGTVKNRIKLGWDAARILLTPIRPKLKNKKPHPIMDGA